MNKSDDNTGCPFCDPAIRNLSFYENNKFIAIYNIAPILPGHVLVIPIKHLTSFFDLANKDLFEFINFSRIVIRILSTGISR